MRKAHSLLVVSLFLLALSSSSCCWAGVHRGATATATPRSATASIAQPTATLVRPLTTIPKPLATATAVRPSATSTVAQPKVEPTRAATTASREPLALVDPPLDELSPTLSKLPTNAQFRILLREQYLSAQAASYLATAQDLPIQISDILINLTPGAIEISGRVPFGFMRVEIFGRGTWRAESCRFVADIVEVRIAGQNAPATLRDQIGKLLQDALRNLADAPVCFTQVEVRRGEVEIRGYRK